MQRKKFSDVHFLNTNKIWNNVEFLPLTYAAMASAVSLSGSMVMRMGVRLGRAFILSEEHKHDNNWYDLLSGSSEPVWLRPARRYLFRPPPRSSSPARRGRCRGSGWSRSRGAPTGPGSLRSWLACCCGPRVKRDRPALAGRSIGSVPFRSLREIKGRQVSSTLFKTQTTNIFTIYIFQSGINKQFCNRPPGAAYKKINRKF